MKIVQFPMFWMAEYESQAKRIGIFSDSLKKKSLFDANMTYIHQRFITVIMRQIGEVQPSENGRYL